MKKLLALLTLFVIQASAEPVLYDGFRPEGAAGDGHVGTLGSWHRMQGEVETIKDGIGMPGLSGRKGGLMLTKKGEALAEIDVDVSGTYYGSFRMRTSTITKDSLLAVVFAGPDLQELTPKTANLSFLVKAWRSDYGAIISSGKTVLMTEGAPIEAKTPYLVLFKVEDETAARSVQMWILSQTQVLYHSNRSISEAVLNNAALGAFEGGVMQRVRVEPKAGAQLSLSKGDVVACMAKFNPKGVFDEIRISKDSLQDAAGYLAK